jgi:hypothetical protein
MRKGLLFFFFFLKKKKKKLFYFLDIALSINYSMSSCTKTEKNAKLIILIFLIYN